LVCRYDGNLGVILAIAAVKGLLLQALVSVQRTQELKQLQDKVSSGGVEEGWAGLGWASEGEAGGHRKALFCRCRHHLLVQVLCMLIVSASSVMH
jgi:hypothetical protein